MSGGCRSSEWGVMPFHWYFTSALPRSLLGTLPLVLLGGLLERRIRFILLLTAAYVLLYSFLPHKEVCFDCKLGLMESACVQSCVRIRCVIEAVRMQLSIWFSATALYNLFQPVQLVNG